MSVEARKIRLIMALRRAGIHDTGVLSAMERIAREAFVPEPFKDQAYENRALPIECGQTLSQPGIVATMTQALAVERRHKVLEIGTGSGYQAAVLSRLCRRLYTIERHARLLKQAEERFSALRLHNITARTGDGQMGWPEQAPFARIIVTAAAPGIPDDLLNQLAPGGILVAPIGGAGADQSLVRVMRSEMGWREEIMGTVRFVPLLRGVAQDDADSAPAAGPRRATLA